MHRSVLFNSSVVSINRSSGELRHKFQIGRERGPVTWSTLHAGCMFAKTLHDSIASSVHECLQFPSSTHAHESTPTHTQTHMTYIHTYTHARARTRTTKQHQPASHDSMRRRCSSERHKHRTLRNKPANRRNNNCLRRTTVVLGRKMGRIYELLFMDVMCLILTQYSNKLLLLVRAFRGAAKITSTKLSFYRVHDTAGAVKVITMV